MIWLVVNARFSATHSWPEAAGRHAYLMFQHRHEFHVSAKVEQFSNDRDIEYLAFKDWFKSKLPDGADLGTMSCEMLAQKLIGDIEIEYGGGRKVEVTVTEDGENGAIVSNA